MSGHSKWVNIRNRKGKQDALRGKIFTKMGREIAVAVKEGGPDPESNSHLKDIISKAKALNMPNDNIMRSIKRASGDDGAVDYESITYEGYGPGGIAVIVDALTDNRNRTASDVRHFFDKSGGNLGATGCVGWMFDRKGEIIIAKDELDEDEVMMAAIEAGADDVNVMEDAFQVLCDPNSLHDVREGLESAGYEFESAEVTMLPQNTVAVDPAHLKGINYLLDALEECDDVQNVWHNAELPEDDEE